MKSLRLPQLLVRAFWFIALLVGVFYLIERMQRSKERRALAGRALVPDTAQEQMIYFARAPDTIFFAEEAFVLDDIALRASFEARYYYWTLSPADFVPLLQRSYRWSHWIRDALSASDLPLDFLYLAAHRSQLSPNTSGARAGLWGLDTAEARTYGLEISRRRDERLDIFCSTSALASELYKTRSTSSWTKTLVQFCGADLDCIAETLLFSQLLSHPKRFGYHIPPRYRAESLSYQRWYPRDSLSIEALLSHPRLDLKRFYFYNPSLRKLFDHLLGVPQAQYSARRALKGEQLYLPLFVDTIFFEKIGPPKPRTR